MRASITLVILQAALIYAKPWGKRVPDNTAPAGTNPVSIASTSVLGPLNADNSCSPRDLGFFGRLGGVWYAVYGDTTWCAEPNTDPAQDHPTVFPGMVRDSISRATTNPLRVHDLDLNSQTPVPHQNQFVPYNAAWGETNNWGFGGTSLCETNYTTQEGIVFYLRVGLFVPAHFENGAFC